ncbi:hypothetical protein M493_16440 [Geobacillus genomosp. 3]|uniref:SLH domain-containing protein n=1 Tax=Geobacillus genomosp. 3 TaxID=1921421 RepID=S5Z9H0_GEOG3|nr:S-layer homology domain-containing protein [Geobacillus genomosp. 3]AGT33502.1 hypothetical protein M493_16440 [Geobacillus genomosp. 3]
MAYQPKSYRKFAATTATAAMVASAVAPVASLAAGFTDVAPQYKEAVDFLVSTGATNGKTETQFGVYEEITRLDAAVILAKLLKLDVDNAKDAGFTDVPKDRAKYVNALVEAGVLNGKGDGKFGAYDKLTRVQMAKIVANAYKLEKQNDSALPFTDVNATWAPFVKALYDNGVTSGKTPTSFGAYENITRGDFARFVFKAANVNVAPAVVSVSAINAKELVVKFNKAIDKSTVIEASGITAGTLVDGAITVSSLDNHPVTINNAVATLSADGKTLTLQAANAEVFEGRYDVNITKGAIKTTDGKDVEGYKDTIKAEDTVAPSILGTTRVTSTQVKINFSEPINETDMPGTGTLLNKVSFKYADGTSVNGSITYTLSSDKKSLTVNLSDSNITAGKDIVATFVGVKDFAGNIITPNPATVTIQKGQKDGVAPTVVDLKAVNNKTVEVKFSEELAVAPTVNITGNPGTITVTQDSTDKTKYIVKTTNALTGLQTVTVAAGYTDLSGEQGAAYTKVVNFDVDTVAPKLVSATVKKGTDNAEYLELTFDEEVSVLPTLANISVSGTKYKDYVTSSFTATVVANKLVVDTTDKKVARIKLADLLASDDVEGAVYDLTLTGKDATSANVAIVEDVSGNDGATSVKATFTRGKDGVAPSNTKATIDTSVGTNGIAVVDNNTLTVAFNQELDGATATNVNNYKIDGAVVEKAILNPVSGGKQTVTLKLKAGSNIFTGERNVVISGVKAKNGLVMDEYKTTENLKENVAPTITKAQLTDTDKITLTFSEPVKNATQDTNDFELYIGGVKVSSNDTITTAQQTTAGTTLVLTLEQPVTASDLAKGLAIKALDTIDITDVAGNTASVPVNVTVAQ